jgi:catechol 2,3-dioxygenase-like lactoylglutathione lyase family enzyme
MKLPKIVGINHVALEVGGIEQALDFYSKIFLKCKKSCFQALSFPAISATCAP